MPNPTTPIEPIIRAIDTGYATLLLSGRNIRDLDVCPTTGKLRPLLEILRGILKERFQIALIAYDRATGFDYQSGVGDDTRDLQTVETAFRSHNLLDIPQDEYEVSQIIRGISEICRFNTGGLKWSDGQTMRLLFFLDFGEHLIPCIQGMSPTDNQIVAIELAAVMSQSLGLRSSGNIIIFQAQDSGKIDPLVRDVLHAIHLPQPSQAEKVLFLQAATKTGLYDKARFEDGLTIESVAFLTSNTPNRGVEGLLRAANRSGRPISAKELVTQRDRDVLAVSEGTVTALDTSKVSSNTQLQGINSSHPQNILSKQAKALAEGNPNMPANTLLVGPPGTGKTEMSLVVAKQAGVSAYQMNSPKRGIVGETERLSPLQQRILAEFQPNIAFVDEVTEVFPMERSNFNGDSGASNAVSAALLTALADESRRGRSLFIGTTNCPWKIGSAMLSRFVIIPVLHPLEMDYPAIVIATAQRVGSTTVELSDREPAIVAAANIFYKLGANPRHIRSALSNALLLKGELNPQTILFAAQDCTISGDHDSAIYSDLWAVSACTSKSYFPWSDCLSSYPFPPHLQGLVDLQTGDIDRVELQRRIQELKPNANL
jgi:ATPase family associated with various cellular activities (AAA)